MEVHFGLGGGSGRVSCGRLQHQGAGWLVDLHCCRSFAAGSQSGVWQEDALGVRQWCVSVSVGRAFDHGMALCDDEGETITRVCAMLYQFFEAGRSG